MQFMLESTSETREAGCDQGQISHGQKITF